MSVEISQTQMPIVEYLRLDAVPYLLANECQGCLARFFDRRNACGSCGGIEFRTAKVANEAVLKSFSIVHRAAPTVKVPFVSAIVETSDGTTVRSNVVGLSDPSDVKLGMALKMVTYVCGRDDNGMECVAFGYSPV